MTEHGGRLVAVRPDMTGLLEPNTPANLAG
jgi:hypothetical protein